MSASTPTDSAYYRPSGAADGYDHFVPTRSTISVWSDTIQHGGPPSALLVRAMESVERAPTLAWSRVTVDILGPIGLSDNRTRARVIRSGRQIAQVQSELDVLGPDGEFRTAARATAWLLATSDTTEVAALSGGPTPPDDVAAGAAAPDWSASGWPNTGFISTVDVHRADDGTGLTWLRPHADLVEGETSSALSMFCCVVDVANGLGSTLSPAEWTWMNTDTTIHLRREPAGRWFGIDAELVAGSSGFGYTTADLRDESGPVGRSAQTVLLTRA